MDRLTLLDQLSEVHWNIRTTENLINSNQRNYYRELGIENRWNHKVEIWEKCLAYWKRRFNRILNELKY